MAPQVGLEPTTTVAASPAPMDYDLALSTTIATPLAAGTVRDWSDRIRPFVIERGHKSGHSEWAQQNGIADRAACNGS